MPFSIDETLEKAIIAINAGGEVVRENFGKVSATAVEEKARDDYVTYVDKESESRIKALLEKFFPDHAILAEESGITGESPYLWILDPLDGTTNFIHGFPFVSLSLALEKEDEIIIGVVLDPLRDEIYWALKGRGAYLNGQQIKVNQLYGLEGSLLATGFPFRTKKLLPQYLEIFRRLFLRTTGIRRAGSAALDLAYVAKGVFSGFFEFGLSLWDIAAGSLLIEEAGGVVTDFRGGKEHFSTGNIIAGSPLVHREMLQILKGVLEIKETN